MLCKVTFIPQPSAAVHLVSEFGMRPVGAV